MSELSPTGASRRRLVAILTVAGLYFAVGKLGLLLAIPPGYATPVWLPAGVALVAILLYGEGVWMGVALGSFLVNVGTSFSAESTGDLLRSIALPAAIAAGAALQGVVAARLVRRFVGFPDPLIRPRSIFGFLLLGGPIGCLVAPTVGALSMIAFGVLPGRDFPVTWGTWWVGDTLGVLVGAPVVLCASSRETIWRRRRMTVALPLSVLLVATVFGLVRVRQWHRSLETKALSEAALQTALVLEQDFERYQELLLAIRRYFEASADVTRQGFHGFVESPLQRLPGIQALAWSPRLAAEARAAAVAASRAAGFSDFELTELDAAGQLVRAAPRAEYFPVVYLEPYRGNERTLGFDLASEAERRQTLERARDTAAPTASGRIRLVQEAGEQWGFLVAVPVYSAARPAEITARRAALRGFVIGTFRIGDMLAASLRKVSAQPLGLEIHDEEAPPEHRLLYPFAATASIAETAMDAKVETHYAMGDRSWRLVFHPTPELLARQQPWQVWIFLVLALALVGLVGAVLLVTTGEAASIALLVDERTAELRHTEERYRHLIESSSGLICTHDLAGVLTSINAAAAAALGYAPAEMLGRGVQEFLHPDARSRFAEYLERIASQGEDDGITHWLTADGREMYWHYRNRLLRREGDSSYVLGFAVDATEQIRDAAVAVHRAHHDALTGLPNRYLFQERLERATALAARERFSFTVMFLDLDGLKVFNDQFGHAAGDWALQEVGQRLAAIIRRSDTASRYAGDEFALLLLGAQRAEDAERVAAHILRSLAEPAEYQGQRLDLSVSIGIGLYPRHGTDPETLLRNADAAMYTAKRGGGRRFAFPPEAPVLAHRT